jgi:DnaJ domain
MNPYQILGIAKDCTREEAKEAFRSRAYHAHPDRGGDTKRFIRIRKAYEQILADLERQPVPDADKTGQAVDKSGQLPRRDRRSKPPDPNWEPDFVLLDETPRRTRPPRPRDPDWKPDLILLDETPLDPVTVNAADGDDAWQSYRTLFQRISAKSARAESTWQFGWIYAIGMLILLIVIVLLSLMLFWADSTTIQQTEPVQRPIYDSAQQ